MEKLLMLKMEQLEIAESCIEHYSAQSEVFKGLAKKAHALYEEMDRELDNMRKKHESVDADMDKKYHEHQHYKRYHDHHKERAERVKREIHR